MSFWCDDHIFVRIVGPDGEREVALDQPYALIGYGSRSSIVLEGPGVRKRALLLIATKIGVYAVNLDRAEAPPDEPGRWITSDEPLTVGPYQLSIQLSSGKVASPDWPDLLAARSPLPIPVLHVFGDGLLKDRRRLRHPLCLVGRRPQCSLQLRGEQVSSYHAAFYWQDQRLWCFDLQSGNGTLLNGAALTCSEVKLNDRLEIGEFELSYYRWSPRHTTPGVANLQLDEEGAIWDSASTNLAADGSRVAVALDSDDTQLRQRLAAEFEERLAAERQAFLAAQDQWDAQRQQLQSELARLKEHLDPASSRTTDVASNASTEAVPAPHFDVEPMPDPVAAGSLEPPGPAPPATPESVATAPSAAPPAPALESLAIAVKPGGRRKAQPRRELSSFVSGRLSDLEQTQRRHLLILWSAAVAGAVALGAVALGATAFGAWARLF